MRKIKRKYFIVEATVVVLVIVVGMAIMLPRFVDAQNFNTPGNFPDPEFRRAIEILMEVEPGGKFSWKDLRKLKEVDFVNNNMKSIKGIGYLTGITHLKISTSQIWQMDLSSNVNLLSVHIWGTGLEHLDISGCKTLEDLNVSYAQLQELDTSGNPELISLDVHHNQIRSLDVSHNKKLTALNCQNNPLQTLEVGGLTELKELTCSHTLLRRIDLSSNLALSKLYCNHAKLESLDISHNPNITFLTCNDNLIDELDIRNNVFLRNLDLENCLLTELDTTNNPNLQMVSVAGNQLKSVPDFRSNSKIISLRLERNLLDCEDWEAFVEQDVNIRNFIFAPQIKQTLSNCEEKIGLYKRSVINQKPVINPEK